ncbi:MAG: hypothetical protein JSR46_11850 [Verrucomicrobia bacterium]|nr:hypothetical protein [Verrucomicrobiota bacterium]
MNSFLSKMFVFLALLISFCASQADAVSLGRAGKSYKKNSIKWQDIFMKGNIFHIKASMPGSPSSHIRNGQFSIQSEYGKVYYRIETVSQDNQRPPKNYNTFIKQNRKAIGKFQQIPSTKKYVKYALNYKYTTPDGMPGATRVYVTNKKIYVLHVRGANHAQANRFFNSFSVQKE